MVRQYNGWAKFLDSVGLTQEQSEYYMKHVVDSEEFIKKAGIVEDLNSKIYYKDKSNIHGEGIFASVDIEDNQNIGLVFFFGNKQKYRSLLGRFTNHSNYNNIDFIPYYSRFSFIVEAWTKKSINKGDEILVNYKDHWGKF
tara:strand:+ start:401 stop:823 length:423 start_codon:yes stop_codon:yes gene_type:complete